jgi:hypothetical protein
MLATFYESINLVNALFISKAMRGSMKIETHTRIDRELCGTPLEVGEGFSRV